MRAVFAMRAEGAAMALLHTEQIMEMGAMGVDGNGWELWEPSGRLGGMGIKKSEKDYFSLFSSSRILSILMVALMAASVWSASSARVL